MPVYLTGGLVLCPRAEVEFGNFIVAAAYSSLIAFAVKLLAIAMQQVLIGQQLGRLLAVRRFIGVNSPTMKAIKLILAEPGLKYKKVVILVGGPDWPTSVTTGIMRLSVGQMLLGSLPHAIPISLVVFAGGMLIKSEEGGTWLPLSEVFIALASMIYPVLFIMALVQIWATVATRKGEIDEMPDDTEVQELDTREAALEVRARNCVAWPSMARLRQAEADAGPNMHDLEQEDGEKFEEIPPLWKAVLVMATICAHISTMAFRFFGNSCFEDVDLMTNISLPPFNGNAFHVVKQPVGIIFNAIFIVGVALGLGFRWWAAHQLRVVSMTDSQATG